MTSQIIDTVIFIFIAFGLGLKLPMPVLINMAIGQYIFKFFLHDHQILIAEAHHGIHLCAHFMQFSGHGIGNGTAHAAADNAYLFQALGMGGDTQGSNEIGNIFALFLVVELFCSCANYLENNFNSSFFPI